MEKYKLWGFNTSLVLFVVLLSSVVLASPFGTFQEALGEFVVNIAFLGSLLNVFGSTSQAQIAGFMRVLYGILAFSIWYFAGGFVFPEQRNIRISISAILSILSVIFIPEAVILAITFGYSTLFSTVLLSIAYGSVVAVVFIMPSDNRAWIAGKIAILGALWWVNGLVTDSVNKIIKSSVSSGLLISSSLIDLFGIVNSVLMLLIVWQFAKLFFMEGHRQIFGGGGVAKAYSFFTKGSAGEKARKDAVYVKSQQLNDYVLEQREAQSVEAFLASIDGLESHLVALSRASQFDESDRDKILEYLAEAEHRLVELDHLAQQLRQATFHAERGIKELERDAKKSSRWNQDGSKHFWQSERGALDDLDNHITQLHKEHEKIIHDLTKITSNFKTRMGSLSRFFSSIKKFPVVTATASRSGRATLGSVISTLARSLASIRSDTIKLRDEQLKAYSLAEKLAAYFEKY